MKTFLSSLFILISLVVNSQTIDVERKPKYFGLEISEQDVLDSLKIPYVSIQERNGVNGYGEKIEVNERKISEFNKFFNKNNEGFVFTPNENTEPGPSGMYFFARALCGWLASPAYLTHSIRESLSNHSETTLAFAT